MGRGALAVSPSKEFSIFNNSTRFLAAVRDGLPVPNRLNLVGYREFRQLVEGKRAPLHYSQEYYSFLGPPPDELQVEQLLQMQPIACFQHARCGQTVNMKVDAPCAGSMTLTTPRLRVTLAGSTHVLHYDESNTVLVQLHGVKQITLVSPLQLPLIYPYDKEHLLYRRARFNLTAPDYQRFPMSRALEPVTVTLTPGDMLIFPHHTAHTTMALTDCVGVSFRWQAGSHR